MLHPRSWTPFLLPTSFLCAALLALPGCDGDAGELEGEFEGGTSLPLTVQVGTQLITSAQTDLKAEPSKHSSTLKTVSAGTVVTALESAPTSRYYHVSVAGTLGWIKQGVLQAAPSSGSGSEPASPTADAGTASVGTSTVDAGCTLLEFNLANAWSDTGNAWGVSQGFGAPADNSNATTQSGLRLFENGRALGPAHAIHAEIRTMGQGRFSHWASTDGSGEVLRFSSSDNSDPRSNGRTYSYCIGSGTVTTSPGATSTTPVPTPTGPVFYVSTTGSDSNSGSQSAPWRTIGKAARNMIAGDTTIVLDGTYEEGFVSFGNSGTRANRITLRAQNKWGAKLASTSGCTAPIDIRTSWITIDGLHVTVSPRNVACTVKTAANAGIYCWGMGPATLSSPYKPQAGCVIRNVQIDSAGRSLAVKTTQDYAIVENGLFHSSIEAMNSYGNIYRYNTVDNHDAWGSYLIAKGGVRSFQAYGNLVRIKNVWANGLVIGGHSGNEWTFNPTNPREAYDSVAFNNVVVNESGGSVLALGLRGAEDCALYNNVVINSGIFVMGGGAPVTANTVNPMIKNNIIDCGGTAAQTSWTYSATATVDYNNFYNCTGAPTQSHAVVGNPLFVNRLSNWHLQSGSPATGAGTAVSFIGYLGEVIDVSRDRDGGARTLPWNLGIY